MKTERINRIEIDWKDLFKPIPGLLAGPDDDPVINKIVIKPEIIPIIFVPGIMGSRLRYSMGDKKAWDPDESGFMAFRYGFNCSPEERKKCLIGKQSHNPDYLKVDKDSINIPAGTRERGWGGVAWSFYGTILRALARHEWPEPLQQCFDLPVYAFGYNWTDSNDASGARLSKFIGQVIADNAKKLPCRHVILVTHSMGGLVARSACKLHGAESKVLGVVHGVQPSSGAPAAYFRMKNGFEPPGSPTGRGWDWLRNPVKMLGHKIKGYGSRMVLGRSGEEVTVLMANSPGALELLPNKLYKTNDGSGQWLRCTGHHGKIEELPKSDPYAEIYENQDHVYRLVNREWLGDTSDGSKAPFKTNTKTPWIFYTRNLEIAKSFHNKLQDSLHPETFQFFSTGIKTADKVEIKCSREDKAKIHAKAHRYRGFFEAVNEKGQRQDLNDLLFISAFREDSYKDAVVYAYTLAEPDGSGDGTVPDSSGRALKAKPTGYIHGPDGTVSIGDGDEGWFDRQHDGVYSTRKAQKITLRAIENLCKTKIKKETGIA